MPKMFTVHEQSPLQAEIQDSYELSQHLSCDHH